MNFDIVAEQDGRIIIEADDLFMEETLNNVSQIFHQNTGVFCPKFR